MNDAKINNLYEAITSQTDYVHYIESQGTDNIDFSNCNFKLLKAIYCGFYLSNFFDENFEVIENEETKEKSVKTCLIKEYVQELIEKVATKTDNGYVFGKIGINLGYKDENQAFLKLRNKLSHGDFIIRDNNIVFEENNTEAIIDLDKLLSLLDNIEDKKDINKKTGTNTKIYNFCDHNIESITKIKNEEDLDKTFKKLYRIEVIDYPIFPRVRNTEYVDKYNEVLEKIYNKIQECLNNKSLLTEKELNNIIDSKKIELEKYGIGIKCNLIRYNELPYYNDLKNKFMIDLDLFKKLNFKEQIHIINNYSYQLGHGKKQKFNIQKGIILNLVILNILEKNPNQTLNAIMFCNPRLYLVATYHYEDIVLSNYLVGFNTLYEYGLETNLATNDGNVSLEEIYDNKVIDFSKIDFSSLEVPGMEIRKHVELTYPKIENDEVIRLRNVIKAKENNYNNYLNNSKNKTEEKEKELLEQIEISKKELDETIDNNTNRLIEIKTFKDNLDIDKYEKNLNIIYYIRNAIAHGNVYINPNGVKTVNEKLITFENYDKEGNLVYHKEISIGEFNQIFKTSNYKELYNYVVSKLNDKSIVREGYLDKIDVRLLIRKVR